MIYYY